MRPLKLPFYLRAIFKLLTPLPIYKRNSLKHFRNLSFSQKRQLLKRVNYYIKLDKFTLEGEFTSVRTLLKFKSKTYHLDLAEYLRVFPRENRINVLFGDVTEIPPQPTIVKSRPITSDNQNSVLLKLNKIRHYNFINDRMTFEQKIPKAVWRGAVFHYQPHRVDFINKLYQHPLCNVGGYNKRDRNQPWEKEYLNIPEQLKYRYIFCIEGNDVATNLKWAMSSNSLCLMPRPKFETWFMEGALIAGHHYVELKDDYSDVDEKINYYNEHPSEAQAIIDNAHSFVEQFKQLQSEDILSFLVLRKYFKLSGQPWKLDA